MNVFVEGEKPMTDDLFDHLPDYPHSAGWKEAENQSGQEVLVCRDPNSDNYIISIEDAIQRVPDLSNYRCRTPRDAKIKMLAPKELWVNVFMDDGGVEAFESEGRALISEDSEVVICAVRYVLAEPADVPASSEGEGA